MGLEIVLNQILARGQEEESSVLKAAEAERDRILSEAEGRAREIKQRRKGQTDAKVEALRREILSASEFEVRRRLLVARRELLEDFHQRVGQALTNLSANQNKALLSKLHERAKQELPNGVVHARGGDLAVLAKNGYQKGRETGGVGGFQVESPDQTVVLDYRFESLLENVWKKIVAENQALFEV